MTVFYDVDKAVSEFQDNMRKAGAKASECPALAAQIRGTTVQVEFMRWSLTEMNLNTDQDDIVHAAAAIVANIIVNVITNADEQYAEKLLPKIFSMLENGNGITASEVHVDSLDGGRA